MLYLTLETNMETYIDFCLNYFFFSQGEGHHEELSSQQTQQRRQDGPSVWDPGGFHQGRRQTPGVQPESEHPVLDREIPGREDVARAAWSPGWLWQEVGPE